MKNIGLRRWLIQQNQLTQFTDYCGMPAQTMAHWHPAFIFVFMPSAQLIACHWHDASIGEHANIECNNASVHSHCLTNTRSGRQIHGEYSPRAKWYVRTMHVPKTPYERMRAAEQAAAFQRDQRRMQARYEAGLPMVSY